MRHKKDAFGSSVPCWFSLYCTLHTRGLSSGCTSNFPHISSFLQLDFTASLVFYHNFLCAYSKLVTIHHLPGKHQKSSSLKIPVNPSFRFSQAISTTTGTPFEPCKFSMVSSSGKTISVVRCGNFKNTNQLQRR